MLSAIQRLIDVNPFAVATALAMLSGVIGMPIIQGIKKLFGLEDKAALAGATVVSVVLAVVLCAVNGDFLGISFTLPDVINAAGVIFAAATLLYKAIVKGKKPEEPDDPSTPV